jgi:hypothetical protein
VPRRPVPLFEFFDKPRRRDSAIVPYGLAWRDSADPEAFFSVNWMEGTGELYVVRVPDSPTRPYPALSLMHVTSREETEGLTIEVLTTVPERAAVDALLRGWEEFMALADSLGWVRAQVAQIAGVARTRYP